MSENDSYVTKEWFYPILHVFEIIRSVIIAFGFVGNLISLVIYCRNVFRKKSIGTYLSCLSISNLVIFLIEGFNLIQKFIQFEYNSILCNINRNLSFISIAYSSWIFVAFSFDTLFSSVFRQAYPNLNKKFKPNFVLPLTLPVIVLIDLYFLLSNNISVTCETFNVSVIEDDENNEVKLNLTESTLEKQNSLLEYLVVNMIMVTILPFILMTISSYVLIVKMFNRKTTVETNDEIERRKRKRRFARRTIITNLVFLVCLLPIDIISILQLVMNRSSLKHSDVLYLLHAFFYTIDLAYRASFLFISLFLNRLFKKELLIIFRFKKRKRKIIRSKRCVSKATAV
jgi:hypothetical protein